MLTVLPVLPFKGRGYPPVSMPAEPVTRPSALMVRMLTRIRSGKNFSENTCRCQLNSVYLQYKKNPGILLKILSKIFPGFKVQKIYKKLQK